MLYKKVRKERGNATYASIEKEMAKPRMAKSARIAELNQDTARIPKQPSTTMHGIVDKIIPSTRPSQSEKAQIAVDGRDQKYRGLRIETTLTDERGDALRLKAGARVEVTATAKEVNSQR
jgi:tRNA A37 methylthiotransferase MiaB